jgi:hypothetical protein
MALRSIRPAIYGGLREARQTPSPAPFTGLLARGFSRVARLSNAIYRLKPAWQAR